MYCSIMMCRVLPRNVKNDLALRKSRSGAPSKAIRVMRVTESMQKHAETEVNHLPTKLDYFFWEMEKLETCMHHRIKYAWMKLLRHLVAITDMLRNGSICRFYSSRLFVSVPLVQTVGWVCWDVHGPGQLECTQVSNFLLQSVQACSQHCSRSRIVAGLVQFSSVPPIGAAPTHTCTRR